MVGCRVCVMGALRSWFGRRYEPVALHALCNPTMLAVSTARVCPAVWAPTCPRRNGRILASLAKELSIPSRHRLPTRPALFARQNRVSESTDGNAEHLAIGDSLPLGTD